MKKKALIFFDQDLTIRHFLLNKTFSMLENTFDCLYIFIKDAKSKKNGINLNFDDIPTKNKILFNVPRKRMGQWDVLGQVTILKYQKGTSNYNARKELTLETRGKKLTFLYILLSLPIIFNIFRYYIKKRNGVYQPLKKLIDEYSANILIHPTVLNGYIINDLINISNKHNIPCILLMNSWDNPSVKSVVTGYPDKLVVWGEQTKEHAIEYMKIPRKHIECFGAAQFQLYRTPVSEPENEIKSIFNVPFDRPIILYAGAGSGPHESKILKLLDNAIENEQVPSCHVIYRPHPWRGKLADGELSFYDLNCKNITIDPHMQRYYDQVVLGTGSDLFEMTDYEITKKILSISSAVISPLSTILLESILLGKPILMFFPNKDIKEEAVRITKIKLNVAQFKGFWDVPGINMCFQEEELPITVSLLLKQSKDESIKNNLLKHSCKYVVMDGDTYSKRLYDLANKIAN